MLVQIPEIGFGVNIALIGFGAYQLKRLLVITPFDSGCSIRSPM